jgi:SAM-dependent methyltransferase
LVWDPVWEEIFRAREWGKYPAESLIRFVAQNFYTAVDRAAVHLLEVGCGPGANLWYLAREGFSFVGVDGSPTAIDRAARRLDDECAGWRRRGELQVGDIGGLHFADAIFDAVIDCEAIYCNPWDAAQAIYRETARVARPGAKLYSRTFAAGTWGDGTGEAAGHNTWRCSEGPMAGKGLTRFTELNEIENLVEGWSVTGTEMLTCSVGNRRHEIREWVIEAERK